MAKQTYDPATIEPTWQAVWAERRAFRTPDDPDVLRAPGPSTTCSTCSPTRRAPGCTSATPRATPRPTSISRFKRAKGHNVLHPMGWDAFGLPAERVRGPRGVGTRPRSTAEQRRQLQAAARAAGFLLRLERRGQHLRARRTYKWTQWIFTRSCTSKGLAYDEPTHRSGGARRSGRCSPTTRSSRRPLRERGDHPCERRPHAAVDARDHQAYAQRLLGRSRRASSGTTAGQGRMQREWIGRSRRRRGRLRASRATTAPRCGCSRPGPDTLFGASFMVLAPEHPLVEQGHDRCRAARRRRRVRRQGGDEERAGTHRPAEAEDRGSTGAYARNALFGKGTVRRTIARASCRSSWRTTCS
jgi:leucyl-tRNA synthetase